MAYVLLVFACFYFVTERRSGEDCKPANHHTVKQTATCSVTLEIMSIKTI